MIRIFDICLSGLGLIVLSPLLFLVAIWIKLDSTGPVFYQQQRVGQHGRDFYLFKFRSMRVGADKGSLITVGSMDPRVTKSGYYLRKCKLDELPQLINVFKGDMSMVGPRPEVRRYVDLYTEEQREVLRVKPGITDYASIEYADENTLLGESSDPEKVYVEIIMPDKIALNMKYIENQSISEYFKVIFFTLFKLVKR